MSLQVPLIARFASLVVAITSLTTVCESLAVGIDDYRHQRTFVLPVPGPGAGGNVLFDPLPDGRLLVLNGANVSVETAPQSGTFASLGDIPGFAPGFGPSFLAVTPDGARAAAGSNGGGSVVVFETSDPNSVASFAMQDFSGEWIDNRYLAVSNFTSSAGVQVLDTATAVVTQVIANIGGASTSVTFDGAGNLYTGNGFDLVPGGSETGWIKSFSAAAWQNALATSTPLDFETTGVPVADLLTGFPLGFDTSGNLFVGGGDFFGGSGDLGYAALVNASAVADALAFPQIAPTINSASPADIVRKFASPPQTIEFSQPPSWNYNFSSGELYLNYAFGDGMVDVYAVPEPNSFFLASLGTTLLILLRRVR
jgi:hypothetical protein